MRILYLEDDPSNLALVERVARMHNDELITVQHPQAAYDELVSGPFDIFITDIQLGPDVMDGLDFTAYLRENGLDIPIIAITAYDYDDYKRRSAEAGTTHHIVKPVSVGDLVALFDQFR